jgi:hypothetical protein
MEEEREVEWSEASRWAAENGADSSNLVFKWVQVVTRVVFPEIHFLEASSLTGDNVEAPFMLVARSILLSIESGQLDPEKAGSGVSYGDRALRRINSNSRLSFGSFGSSQATHRRRPTGTVKLKLQRATQGKCC